MTPCNAADAKLVTIHDIIRGLRGIWHVTGHFDCTSTNIIKVLSCDCCNLLYIGETKRRLADRVSEHFRSIRLNTVSPPVAAHFNLANHTKDDFHVCVIKELSSDFDRKRCVQWGSAECSSRSTCFDFPADHVTCLLVESFALAGTIVWVADGWLFCAHYAVLPCEA